VSKKQPDKEARVIGAGVGGAVGGVVGALMGGPVGAVIGSALAAWFGHEIAGEASKKGL
jgi:outer membrane lipoprotein SlyB